MAKSQQQGWKMNHNLSVYLYQSQMFAGRTSRRDRSGVQGVIFYLLRSWANATGKPWHGWSLALIQVDIL